MSISTKHKVKKAHSEFVVKFTINMVSDKLTKERALEMVNIIRESITGSLDICIEDIDRHLELMGIDLSESEEINVKYEIVKKDAT